MWLPTLTTTANLEKGYLKLADLYMEDLEYPTAQAYYDSALVHMDDDSERKDEVSSLGVRPDQFGRQLEHHPRGGQPCWICATWTKT